MLSNKRVRLLLVVLLLATLGITAGQAQEAAVEVVATPAQQASKDYILPEVKAEYEKLYADAGVQEALAFIEADNQRRIEETLEMVQITATPFNEDVRAADFARRFRDLGLEEVTVDAEGNVLGLYRGTKGTPKLVFSAHMDTVFPLGYDATPTIDPDGTIHAPSIADDTAGLTGVLSIIRAMKAANIRPVGDILFVGTVGEEGRGDLRGVKYLFSSHKDIDGFISMDCDPAPPTRPYGATRNALGSYRFEFLFKGPGGHSRGAFGTPSPIQAMGRAVAKISDMKELPDVSFTASVVSGGSSVNAIAEECLLMTDTRCLDPAVLKQQVDMLVEAIHQGVAEENARWKGYPNSAGEITVEVSLVGLRPSGVQDVETPTIQASMAAAEVMPAYHPVVREGAGSTDSNIPIFLGVPAITIGRGGASANNHALTETWSPYDDPDTWEAIQAGFLTGIGLVGVDGVSEPVLPKHPGYEYTFEGLPFIPEMYIEPGKDYSFSWIKMAGQGAKKATAVQ